MLGKKSYIIMKPRRRFGGGGVEGGVASESKYTLARYKEGYLEKDAEKDLLDRSGERSGSTEGEPFGGHGTTGI